MGNSRIFFLSLLTFFFAIGLIFPVHADTVKASDLATVLDSPEGLEFSNCTNAKKLSKYTEKYIGTTRKEGPGTVQPTNGVSFLQMNGSGNKGKEARSARVKSTFSFTVGGSGTLTFNHRVSTWGGWNDDYLVFYEGDIDDEDSELLALGGDYWDVYSEDGLLAGYDVTVDNFWDDASFGLDCDRYFHTVKVALLAPANTEDYEDPEEEDEEADMLYDAWLDNFVWEPSTDVLCDFLPESGSTFAGNGLTVYLNSNYETVVFYYTTDGSTPSVTSALYNDDDGIEITQDTVLKVAAYENGNLITDAITAEYTMRPAPNAPVCTVTAQEATSSGATAYFGVSESTVPLEFHYTLDGTEPTAESASGQSCEISAPCTLKVRAYDDGTWGEISTYTVRNAPAPTMTFFSEIVPSENFVFDSKGFIALKAQNGSAYYTLNGGEVLEYAGEGIWIEETTDLIYWGCVNYAQELLGDSAEILLNSTKATQKLTQAKEGDATWLTEQITSDGWNLVGMKHIFSGETAIQLAGYLEPYAYDAGKNAYVPASEVEPGKAYFVYGKEHGIPEMFYYLDEEAEPVQPGNKWDMTSGGADYTYEKGAFRTTTAEENAPGWKKGE